MSKDFSNRSKQTKGYVINRIDARRIGRRVSLLCVFNAEWNRQLTES